MHVALIYISTVREIEITSGLKTAKKNDERIGAA